MTDREITVTIKIDTLNDDRRGWTKPFYVGRHIEKIGERIVELGRGVAQTGSGKIRDDNGNTIGEWSIDGDLTD
jgi:hypothetical protein